MKVCQLCAVDFTLYHFLLPLMRETARHGHEVVGVCADGPLVARVRESGLRVEPVPFQRSYSLSAHLRAYRRLRDFFKRETFDVVHVHTPVAALIGRFAAWRAGVPKIVYTAHGFYFHDQMPKWKRAVFIALEWIAGRLTHVLFTQSAEDAETARRYHLCRTGDIRAIGNGSDPGKFKPAEASDPARRALRERLGAGDEDVVILMVGRLVAEKGYPELIEAMRHVDAQLWVAGERLASDHASRVDHAIEAAGSDPVLRSRIRFLGYRDDIAALMAAADIFTLPSHREGMPRSIVEAMLSGLPVVATDIRGSREEVVDGETGLLAPVNDAAALAAALNRLVGDQVLRFRLGFAGSARALELYDEAKIIEAQLQALGLTAGAAR
jgi:glycosyltransferase involved in cell wall biosynthesis